jgi:hypothetical protein
MSDGDVNVRLVFARSLSLLRRARKLTIDSASKRFAIKETLIIRHME